MDSRLNYHTSITQSTKKGGVLGEPWFPNYHTSLSNTTIAFENLKKINNKLDENNIISLAYLSTNQYISDEEREQFKTQLKEKSQKEYEMYSKYINDIICRDKNRSVDESECVN
jgi:hypothetical protein